MVRIRHAALVAAFLALIGAGAAAATSAPSASKVAAQVTFRQNPREGSTAAPDVSDMRTEQRPSSPPDSSAASGVEGRALGASVLGVGIDMESADP